MPVKSISLWKGSCLRLPGVCQNLIQKKKKEKKVGGNACGIDFVVVRIVFATAMSVSEAQTGKKKVDEKKVANKNACEIDFVVVRIVIVTAMSVSEAQTDKKEKNQQTEG